MKDASAVISAKRRTGLQAWFLSVVSGKRSGAAAAVARMGFAAVEPVYRTGILTRNFLYTRKLFKSLHARRPVISIGNVTTGGTGKTPMVAWLVGQLREAGRSPAVLLRGYRSHGERSDEELLLRDLVKPSPVCANPNRLAGSEQVLGEHPQTDVFVLDDGLQHQQLARHLNIVLVDATMPFGHGHVLPRGLLREPMRAFRRAQAVVVTRADLVDARTLVEIEQRIRAEHRDVPIFRCHFRHDSLRDAIGQTHPIEDIRGRRVFAFCGIGNPDAFFEQLRNNGAELIGSRRFEDHHHYTTGEISECFAQAKTLGAALVLTTEKDWVKIAAMGGHLSASLLLSADPPIMRVGISLEIQNDGGARLLKMVMDAIHRGDANLGWRVDPKTEDVL